MIGAIVGDIVGSVYEHDNAKSFDFPLFRPTSKFTDDTVLTLAVADCLLNGDDYAEKFETYYYRYPNAGFGAKFHEWASSRDHKPYNSWGNGSAMRVAPVGFALKNIESVLDEAEKTAAVTHNHPEGVKGSQAVAAAIFLARQGEPKIVIKKFIETQFAYDLSRTLAQIKPTYQFDISCQGTVPQAITAFLESDNFEDAIRKAVFLGGDSDTLACIAGGIAEAFYKEIPADIVRQTFERLDEELSQVVRKFAAKFQ
jgi:ADP-ribosylglycohydrolase